MRKMMLTKKYQIKPRPQGTDTKNAYAQGVREKIKCVNVCVNPCFVIHKKIVGGYKFPPLFFKFYSC